MKNQRILLAAILCLLFLVPAILHTREESRSTPQMEAKFQTRSSAVVALFKGRNYGNTRFENEKKSYPKAMLDLLAGNRTKAIAFCKLKMLMRRATPTP